MATITQDPTMQLKRGNAVFLVRNVQFCLPKALLQQHSGQFSVMFAAGASESDDKPIVLDDPVRTFRDWVAVLMTPLQSCLSPSHSACSDLERLLQLLLFCQKYEVTELEKYVLKLVLGLTGADTIHSHLTNSLSAFRVVEIADALSEPKIATSARAIIISDLWSNQMHNVKISKKKKTSSQTLRSPRDSADFVDALLFGERMGDAEIIGAAYYQILASHRPRGSLDGRLTEAHRQRLNKGAQSCAEEWQQIFDDWGTGVGLQQGYSSESYLGQIWKAIAGKRLAHYDVVGKLAAAKVYTDQVWGTGSDVFMIKEKMDRIKAGLYDVFVPPEATSVDPPPVEATSFPAAESTS